jgi:hypothetical protein
MHAWFKRSTLVVLCFIAVWLLVVVYWRNSQKMPSASEAILYLLALPSALLLIAWWLRKLLALVGIPVAKVSAANVSAAAVQSVVQADHSTTERDWHLAIFATALRSPHGASAEDLTVALKSQNSRLQLDAELTTLDGFPMKTGRIADVDIDAALAAVMSWQAALQEPALHWSDEQLRALSMGTDVLQELLPQLISHPHLASYIRAKKIGTPESDGALLPVLRLLPVLPYRWTDEMRNVSSRWFKHLLVQHGWPPELIELVVPVKTEPFGQVDAVLVQAHRLDVPCLCLVVACESWIGEDSILAWDQAGKLRKAKVDSGQTPGEGAVGLLLGDMQQAQLLAVDAQYTKIHRMASGRRDKSADARGSTGGELLVQLVQDAIQNAGITPEEITLLASDGDHRRLAEVFVLESDVFTGLDFRHQCLKVAADCGSADAVSSLSALALAHHEASVEQGIALCIGCQDAYERVVLVVQPGTP